MPQREFEIIINSKGEVELSIHGYKGRKCLEALQFFEGLVGPAQVTRHTSEFYEPEEEVRFQQAQPLNQQKFPPRI